MVRKELLPIKENLLTTLKDDLLNRNSDLSSFINLLNTINSSYSIAIDGEWGCGKTFFVKQVELLINAFNINSSVEDKEREEIKNINNINIRNTNASVMAVYYDAWKNDNDSDPIYSLIFEISKQLNEKYKIDDTSVFKLGADFIERITKTNIGDLVNILSSDNAVDRFTTDKDFEDKNKQYFSSLLNERANKMVVFIDELDRCKPTFAIQLLERVKHYFDDDRIIFVFSLNSAQLQHTVKKFYGENFDGSRYLNRFFDITIRLQKQSLDKYYSKIGLNRSYTVDNVCKHIIAKYGLQIREIDKLYHHVRLATQKLDNKQLMNDYEFMFPEGNGKQVILMFIVPLLIGLELHNKDLYKEFASGINSKPLIELLTDYDNDYFVSSLLAENESLNIEQSKKNVSKEEVIKRLYDAIFVYKYDNLHYQKAVGKYVFDNKAKEYAFKNASLL